MDHWHLVVAPGCSFVGGERVKAKSFPPCASSVAKRGDDDGSACHLLVELDRGGEDVGSERGPDTQARVSVVDRETGEQQGGDWIGRAPGVQC